jgi:hypothetical protein
MDILAEGNQVTIKVRNLLWASRDRLANYLVIPEFNEYTGTIVRQKWQGPDEISITSGLPNFPVRRVRRENIIEVDGAKSDYVPVKSDKVTKIVQGSKGNTYIVTTENGKSTCTCPGFGFRKSCKHQEGGE